MAASEMAYPDMCDGTPHPATLTEQPVPTSRIMEASEMAYPEGAYGKVALLGALRPSEDDYQRDI